MFIYMRCLSYGGDYTFSFRCEDCNEKVEHDMDLEHDLNVVYVDDRAFLESLDLDDVSQLTEPFELMLPIQQRSVGWRLLRGKDERAVDKHVRRMVKGNKAKRSDERSDHVFRAALRIEQIDGRRPESIVEAIETIESLKGKDSLAFRQAIEAVSFGIDPELEVTCRNCGYPNDVFLPLDKSFFRPKR